MAGLGGGTFTNYDKIVPGVYFKEETAPMNNVDTGRVVAMLYPTGTNAPFTNRTYVTLSNYVSIIDGINEEIITHVDGKKFIQDILLNAMGVYLIPYSASANKHTYTQTSQEIEALLSDISFDVLLMVSHITDQDVNNPSMNNAIGAVKSIFNNENKRFVVIMRGIDQDWDLIDKDNELGKWFLKIYRSNDDCWNEYFLSGAYSALRLGESLSGLQYNGEDYVNIRKSIPGTYVDTANAIGKGLITFYNFGETKIYILKDITYASRNGSKAPNSYKRGEFVRLEKYIYNFLTSIYTTTIQGKPNNAEHRNLIRGVILQELYRLQSMGIIEDVSATHVLVEKLNIDSILITLVYKPVASMEIVYIKYQVN